MGLLGGLFSAGSSLLGGLLGGKKKSAPQIPNVQLPGLGDYELYPGLKRFVDSRLSGESQGFGPDFLSRTTNPAIAQIDARFKEQTMPRINSELSKRGIARSAGPGLASDIITRAEQDKERGVNDILSQFYYLNELQKKKDLSEGVQVQESLLDKAIGRSRAQAALDQNLPIQQEALNQTYRQDSRTGGAAGSELGLSLASLLQPQAQPSITDTLANYGLGGLIGKSSGPRTNLLGMDDKSFKDYLDQIFGG